MFRAKLCVNNRWLVFVVFAWFVRLLFILFVIDASLRYYFILFYFEVRFDCWIALGFYAVAGFGVIRFV